MNDLEDMKAIWLSMDRRLTAIEEENRRLTMEIKKRGLKSGQEKLMAKYRKFIIFESVMLVALVVLFSHTPWISPQYRWIVVAYWCVFFLFEICADAYLFMRLKRMDVYRSSISEVAAIARKNWKMHKLAIVCGIPLAVGAMVLLALSVSMNVFNVYGMIVGAVIGLCIGLRELMQIIRYYRELQEEND